MTPSDRIITALLLLLALLLVTAAGIFLQITLRRRRQREKATLLFRGLRAAVWGALGIGILCVIYAWQIEPRWIEVTHARVATKKFPSGAGPVRIAQVSDLHCEAAPGPEARLPELVARERPDLIVFTGDALNCAEALPVFRDCMARLARIAPTYAIEGNWDANRWRTLGLFEGTGVKELDGEAVDLTVHGAKLRLGGAPPWRPWWVRYLFREAPDRFNILLYHFPEVITAASQEKVDLVMVGHTHGGQVAAPFYGPVVTFSPAVRRYPHGLFRVGGTCLCVNRGIGTEALPAPPLRFLARPEVTILDIVPE